MHLLEMRSHVLRLLQCPHTGIELPQAGFDVQVGLQFVLPFEPFDVIDSHAGAKP